MNRARSLSLSHHPPLGTRTPYAAVSLPGPRYSASTRSPASQPISALSLEKALLCLVAEVSLNATRAEAPLPQATKNEEVWTPPRLRYNAEGGSRTHMGKARASLSRLRLPIPPLRPVNKYNQIYRYVKPRMKG